MSQVSLLALTQQEAEARLRASGLAVVPLGSIEQHGPHLPCGTDYYAAELVARRVAEFTGGVLVPALHVGVAPYHMPFAGTLTLRIGTFVQVLKDVSDSLIRHGVRTLVFVNAHEGNMAALQVAASEVGLEHPEVQLLSFQVFILARELLGERAPEPLTHAGAIETSAVLAYDPSLVRLERATNPSNLEDSTARHERFRKPFMQPVLTDFREIAPTGWYGAPHLASRALGEEMVQMVAQYIARAVEEASRR